MPGSEPFRVLVVAPTPYFADRGCHVRIYEEALALRGRGVETLIVTYPLGRTPPGVMTSRTLPVPWYRKLEAGPSPHKVYLDGLLLLRALREVRRFRPHVVHAHLHEGAAIALAVRALTRTPMIFDIQGSFADELSAHGLFRRDGMPFRWARRFERALYRRSDALVVNSMAAREMLTRDFGVEGSRIFLVPDAVDSVRCSPRSSDDLRERLGLGSGPVIGFLGLMNVYQGADLLVEAAPQVIEKRPDVRILMMGFPEAPYRRRAEDAGLGTWIRFTGRIPYEEVPDYLGTVTVAVSPKITSTEGNGKLLNYMAAGLPVVAFDTPVNREILGEDAWLVPEQTADALAAGLLAAIDEAEDRGARLRRRAEELFSWTRSVEGLLAAYRSALGRAA